MATTYFAFTRCDFARRLALVSAEGWYLAWRWEHEVAVALYRMAGGFFCEVYFEVYHDGQCNDVMWIQPFPEQQSLEAYASNISLAGICHLLT